MNRPDDSSPSPSADEPGASPGPEASGEPGAPARRRRRGSRGGQRRRKGSGTADAAGTTERPEASDGTADRAARPEVVSGRIDDELPELMRRGRPLDIAAGERALVKKPQIGDTRPAPESPKTAADEQRTPAGAGRGGRGRRGGGRSGGQRAGARDQRGDRQPGTDTGVSDGGRASRRRRREVDPELAEQRRGRERKGRPVGRYFMCVQVRPEMTQIAVLEGRHLVEHYVSRPADDVSQIHGNIYLGRVQNVLPGMEAAFVDIATPKNAVLYRGDLQYDAEDIDEPSGDLKIEQILSARQMILCQVTKNPIGAKGARLTQEVSLPGRFVVLIPNSATYGISKRLPDDVRKRLRQILDRVKPAEHGLIVRTAAEHATEDELRADVQMLLEQWESIAARAAKANRPTLLHREPELAVRVIREEFNADYRGVVIDDEALFHEIRNYVAAFHPELAERIEYYDTAAEGLGLFERHHVHEQVYKALDRKVWLPSGGSLIIEHTEALTVIDVNTGKNVGTSNLEETVFLNNMEAAEEIAKQLRLRDIGGIIVIDFIDMEIKANRAKVVDAFREALARDKTRTQVFEISDLGLVEMTRKRIGEGLLTEFSETCERCEGRGVVVDTTLLD